MPPIWSLLASYHLLYALPNLPLAVVGATAAMTGDGLPALGIRVFGARFPSKARQENIQALTTVLQQA